MSTNLFQMSVSRAYAETSLNGLPPLNFGGIPLFRLPNECLSFLWAGTWVFDVFPETIHQNCAWSMEAHPRACLRRELGQSNRPPIDLKKYLYGLQCKEEDKVRVGENEDNFFEEIPIYDVKFCPANYHPHYLAVADELGCLSIVNTREGEGDSEKLIKKYQCHKNALFSMDWSPHQDGILSTCSGDNTVKLWDLKQDFQDVAVFRGHERTVKSVKFHPSNKDCLCSGGRDGNIILWDTRIGTSSNVIRKAHGSKGTKVEAVSVTDIVFYDDNTVISSAATDGCIKFWDLRKTYSGLKKMIPVSTIEWPKDTHSGQGYVSLSLDHQNNLYACSLHEIFKFNLFSTSGVRTSEPATFLVPYKLNYYVKVNVSRDGQFLISGSSLSESYIWDTYDPSPEPFLYLNSDSQSSCIAVFSPDDTFKVISGGDDGRIQIWRPVSPVDDSFQNEIHEMVDKAHVKSLQEVASLDSLRKLTEEQIETNKREANLGQIGSLRYKTRNFNPTNGLFLSNLLSENYRNHVNYQPNGDHTTKNFDLGSLLKDLPNFAIDGKHPSIPQLGKKASLQSRKPCWLGELKLTLNPPSPNSSSPTTNATENGHSGRRVMVSEKRAYSKISQNQNQNPRPPKKIKLKLKSRAVTNVAIRNTTPKRSPKSSGLRGSSIRRNSLDMSTALISSGNSPTTPNIMKYFAVRPIPFPLPTESSS